MLYSCTGIFSEMAQASPTKLSLSRCNYDLYVVELLSFAKVIMQCDQMLEQIEAQIFQQKDQ